MFIVVAPQFTQIEPKHETTKHKHEHTHRPRTRVARPLSGRIKCIVSNSRKVLSSSVGSPALPPRDCCANEMMTCEQELTSLKRKAQRLTINWKSGRMVVCMSLQEDSQGNSMCWQVAGKSGKSGNGMSFAPLDD